LICFVLFFFSSLFSHTIPRNDPFETLSVLPVNATLREVLYRTQTRDGPDDAVAEKADPKIRSTKATAKTDSPRAGRLFR
jgi:hypothetical protein